MFQNSYQNGTYFEVFDPKSTFTLTQHRRINPRTCIECKMLLQITKFLKKISKVNLLPFSIHLLIQPIEF